MTTNRSTEELAMRDAIETWGRARWPDARVVHELVCSDCRIDMAFIRPDDLIGVEIKSSKDVLDRLEKQVRVFRDHLPEFWVAIAEKWKDHPDKPFFQNEIVVTDAGAVASPSWRTSRNGTCFNRMLDLLWADEARSIAFHHRLDIAKRTPLHTVLPILARQLTGEEIMRGVCRELRGRRAFWKADAPVAA